ncbi:MAG: hypothetical protein RJB01_739 [Actinomycetota bacterium]|jgi:hypothetical protein
MAVAGFFYVLVLGWLAWAFATSGSMLGLGMGAAVAVIAVFGAVFILGEVRLGIAVQRMGQALSECPSGTDEAWTVLYKSADEAALQGDRSVARRQYRQAARAYRRNGE